MPMTRTGSAVGCLTTRRGKPKRPAAPSKSMVSSCAVSADNLKSKRRDKLYIDKYQNK